MSGLEVSVSALPHLPNEKARRLDARNKMR